jgi:hypothetical protein
VSSVATRLAPALGAPDLVARLNAWAAGARHARAGAGIVGVVPLPDRTLRIAHHAHVALGVLVDGVPAGEPEPPTALAVVAGWLAQDYGTRQMVSGVAFRSFAAEKSEWTRSPTAPRRFPRAAGI